MSMEVLESDGVAVFMPVGRLDSNSSGGAEKQVVERIEGGTRQMVFDFGRLDYISSAGLRVVLLTAKLLRPRGGRLAICAMNAQIRDVFEMSGLLGLLTVCDDRDAAARAVGD